MTPILNGIKKSDFLQSNASDSINLKLALARQDAASPAAKATVKPFNGSERYSIAQQDIHRSLKTAPAGTFYVLRPSQNDFTTYVSGPYSKQAFDDAKPKSSSLKKYIMDETAKYLPGVPADKRFESSKIEFWIKQPNNKIEKF